MSLIGTASAVLNAFTNARLRAALGPDIRLTTWLEARPLGKERNFVEALTGFLLAYIGAFALLVPTFGALLRLSSESADGGRLMQSIAGLPSLVFWIANFIWDAFCFCVSLSLMAIFMLVDDSIFKFDVGLFVTLALIYGTGLLLLVYCMAVGLQSARTSVVILWLAVPTSVLGAVAIQFFYDEWWYDGVNTVLNFVPSFFLADCILKVDLNRLLPLESLRKEPWEWEILGQRVATQLCFIASLAFVVLPAIEMKLGRRVWRRFCGPGPVQTDVEEGTEERDGEEEDVAAERARIRGGVPEGADPLVGSRFVLTVDELRKVFEQGRGCKKLPVTAVRGICFGVRSGECFALLGTNGAGKSTTFKMLTGGLEPTSGDAKVEGRSLFSAGVLRQCSYCPQQDILFGLLTPPETLRIMTFQCAYFYGRLRGMSRRAREARCGRLLDELGLDRFFTTRAANLSGGNKRKLQLAMALMGKPSVVFLDEMTTGMDPRARSMAWKAVKRAAGEGAAVVVTSHSMEECEAEADRLGIMVAGRLKALGGVQYLKNKLGKAYTLTLRLRPDAGETSIATLMKKLTFAYGPPKGSFPVHRAGSVEMRIGLESVALSTLFQFVHGLRGRFPIDDFSLAQISLEQLFVQIAAEEDGKIPDAVNEAEEEKNEEEVPCDEESVKKSTDIH